MRRLVLIGSVVVDLVLPVPRLPERGGDLLASGAEFRVGGGYYVLSAAARAGLATAYGGRHGAGPFGQRVRAALQEAGTEPLLAPDEEDDTGVCVAMVEPDAERTFVTAVGVEAELRAEHLAALSLTPADWAYVSGYDLAYPASGPALAAWLPTLAAGVRVVIDPGPLVVDIPTDVLSPVLARTNVLTLNAREYGLLAGTPDVATAAAVLLPRLAPGALLVLRDGAHGATLAGGGVRGLVEVAAPRVVARDTTGAGDVHTGTLVAHLAAGVDPATATAAANRAAASHVEKGILPA